MGMRRRDLLAGALVGALALIACGGAPEVPSVTPDAMESPSRLPDWRLEDVQPLSPRVGQTYGLETFSGKVVVVTLVEGF
jgi:hypothetical protein